MRILERLRARRCVLATDYVSWLMLLGGLGFLLVAIFDLTGQGHDPPWRIVVSGILGVAGIVLAFFAFTEPADQEPPD